LFDEGGFRMFDADHLRVIEVAHRFRYPSAFWERRQELASLAETAWFRETYPGARLIGTYHEVRAVRQAEPDLPDDLIPFLVVGGQQFPDYTASRCHAGPWRSPRNWPVLVWCVHAYVYGWDAGFGMFLDELKTG
jgi:hypothetical protein